MTRKAEERTKDRAETRIAIIPETLAQEHKGIGRKRDTITGEDIGESTKKAKRRTVGADPDTPNPVSKMNIGWHTVAKMNQRHGAKTVPALTASGEDHIQHPVLGRLRHNALAISTNTQAIGAAHAQEVAKEIQSTKEMNDKPPKQRDSRNELHRLHQILILLKRSSDHYHHLLNLLYARGAVERTK
jgi:hypothetical protein